MSTTMLIQMLGLELYGKSLYLPFSFSVYMEVIKMINHLHIVCQYLKYRDHMYCVLL